MAGGDLKTVAGGVRVLANGKWFGDLAGAQLPRPRETTTASDTSPAAGTVVKIVHTTP